MSATTTIPEPMTCLDMLASTDTESELLFVKNLPIYEKEKPYQIFTGEPTDDDNRIETNLHYDKIQQRIEDVRGKEGSFSLGEQGFTFQRWDDVPSLEWVNEEEVKSVYLPAVRHFVERAVGREGTVNVHEMDVFDWRLRSTGSTGLLSDVLRNRMAKIRPAALVHVDQSPLGVLDRLHASLGREKADELISKYRVQIINVWRPLVDVVEDYSLALCDARTVRQRDLLQVSIVTPGSSALKERRSYLAKYSPDYRFYYLSRMTKQEVCLLKIFDSEKPEQGGCVPHTAFKQNNPYGLSRESIEVRIAVFSDRS